MTCGSYHLPIAGGDDAADKMAVGNVREKWKVGFSNLTQFNENFTEVTKAASDLVFADGNVAGSSWVDVCKSATTADTNTVYLSKKAFKVPYALELGLGLSQRFGGQEFYAEMVGVTADDDGNTIAAIETNPTVPADNPISASIVVATNVWTVTLTNSVWSYLRVGDWICIAGCADSRLNVGPVLVTAIGSAANNVITLTSTLADGTYTGVTGGYIRFICHCGGADYHHGIRFYGTSNNNADTISRNGVADCTGNNNRARVVSWNPGNGQTDSAVPNEGGINYASQQYSRPFRSKGVWRTEHVTGSLTWITKDQDSTTSIRSSNFRESEIPAQDQWYALRIRALNLPNLSNLVGTSKAITTVSKAGSTTATITCPGHGLTTNDRIRVYGIRDQTNFANLTTDTAVASVIDANQITIAFGASYTGSSYGGWILRVNGGAVPTVSAIAIQSYNKSFDSLRLVLTGNTTWVGTYGNIVDLQGLVNSSNAHVPSLCGRYRIARISTTVLELDPMDGQEAAIAAIPGSTNAGGTFIQNTSFRWHYARVLDYFRVLVDSASNPSVDAKAFPVRVTGGNLGTQAVNMSQLEGVAIGTLTKHGGTNRSLPVHFPGPVTNADVTSSARTSTGNSGVIVDENGGGNTGATLTVTANSGTSQTLDVSLEESQDNGATWTPIWNFERFTTSNTTAWMPAIPIGGRRRWVWTIAGSSPSFTFKIDTMRSWGTAIPIMRQYFDRTAGVINGTVSNATPAFNVAGCWAVSATVTCSAVTTGAVYNIQVSNDGTNWATASGDVTAIVGTIVVPATTNILARFARVFVKTGGTQTGTVVTLSGSN